MGCALSHRRYSCCCSYALFAFGTSFDASFGACRVAPASYVWIFSPYVLSFACLAFSSSETPNGPFSAAMKAI